MTIPTHIRRFGKPLRKYFDAQVRQPVRGKWYKLFVHAGPFGMGQMCAVQPARSAVRCLMVAGHTMHPDVRQSEYGRTAIDILVDYEGDVLTYEREPATPQQIEVFTAAWPMMKPILAHHPYLDRETA